MKKIILLTFCVLLAFGFSACNYQAVDLQFSYNYAYIRLQNGEVVEGKVESWRDYDGEQLQVRIDGIVYLTNSYNCTLVSDPNIE